MISVYQSGILPIGHFDIKDGDLQDVKGGEILVLDTAASTDLSTPDVYSNGGRSHFRLATGSDIGPFFIANLDKNTGQYSVPGFETTSLYNTNPSYGRNVDSSGKISVFADEGFYALGSDVIDSTTIHENTAPNTRLYVGENGYITATPSSSSAIVGFFIEYRKDSILNNNLDRPFYTPGSYANLDTAIIYKANADGYLNLDISSIAEAIGSNATIGTPDDGYYLDGFFPFTSSTTIANAIDEVNELLAAIVPAKPGDLTGQSLVLSGTTTYSAALPSGLDASWYSGGDAPGDTVSSYIVDNTYTLTSPDQANLFNGGRAAEPSLLGTLTHVLNGVNGDSHNVANDGVGTTGSVTVSDISVYNTVWNKVNAEINYTQPSEGRVTHAMSHTLAGTTNSYELFYDGVNTSPSFDVSPTVSENTAVDGYLSGVLHYATGSTFNVSYTAASGIFQKAYHPTEVSRIELTGAPNTAVNPLSIPAVADTFVVSGQVVSLSSADEATENPQVTVRLFKPNGSTTSATAAIGRSINTYGTESTVTAEYFIDEAQRLILDTTTSWTSSAALVNGNAQVYISGSDGVVGYPRVGDYPGFTGDQEYQRFFSKASTSNGILTLSGISPSDIDPYGTGDLNVLLELENGSPLFYDCGRAVGDNNGSGSGDSRANSVGARVSISGSNLNFSFGVNSTGGANNDRYRLIIIFRNSNHTISSIITS